MAKKAARSKRKPNVAFMKPVRPSAALSEVVGAKPLPRTEVTKKLWAYIKKNKLRDQKNKRMIKSDETLKPIFGGRSQVNMFEMGRLVDKQLQTNMEDLSDASNDAKAGLSALAHLFRKM